jgi:hypothetical protein
MELFSAGSVFYQRQDGSTPDGSTTGGNAKFYLSGVRIPRIGYYREQPNGNFEF